MSMNPSNVYFKVNAEIERNGFAQRKSSRESLTEGLTEECPPFEPPKSSVSSHYTVAYMPNSWGAIVFGNEIVDTGLGQTPHIVVQYESLDGRRNLTVYFDVYRDRAGNVNVSPVAETNISNPESIEGKTLEAGVQLLFKQIRQSKSK